MRPKSGGIAVTLGSENVERPWHMRAAMTPGQEPGHRIIDVEAQKVSAKDLMLAMRVGESQFEPDLPLSARIRADIGPDGIPHMLDGKILVDKGVVIDLDDPLARIPIDRAEINLDWDATRQALVMPFQVVSGGNRITLLAQFDAPREGSSVWGLQVSGGTVVLASAAPADQKPLILNRVALRMRVDPAKQRIDLDPSELGNADLGVALTGSLDFSTDDPRLVLGIAGTRMSVAAMKLLWPICTAPKVRAWVQEHVLAGTVDRLDISTNAPWSTLKTSGPPVPDDGLLIQIVGNGAEVRPVAGLPAIRDADVNLRISGRTAVINVGRGNVEISPGRKLSITNGVFEVPDTFPKAPPAKARFRLDGSVPAAAELLGMERLRDYSGAPIDPATSRGTLTAQVTLALPLKEDLAPGSSIYTINLDIANFVAERMVMGQKVEAALLKVSANNQGHWIRGDVKINGVPAALDYRKPRDADADVRIQATLDESGRSKARLRSQRLPHGAGADQAQRTHSGAGERHPLRDRGRSDPGQGRQPAAGLVEGRRPRGSRDLHAGEQIPGHPLRGPCARSARRFGQGRDRGGWFRRRGVGEFPRLQPVRRRQGDAQGRPQRRRHAARDRTRRRL
jgi:hypothetical protein